MNFKKESNNVVIRDDGKVKIIFDYSDLGNKKIIYSEGANSEIFYIEDNLNSTCEIYLKVTSKKEVIEALKSALPILGFAKIIFSVVK